MVVLLRCQYLRSKRNTITLSSGRLQSVIPLIVYIAIQSQSTHDRREIYSELAFSDLFIK